MQNQELNITEEQVQARIDVVIHEKLEIPRAHVKELIENEDILVNQKKVKASYKVKLNDIISVKIPDAVELDIEAQDIPLDIVYEDEDLIVVNKPIGMITHPAPGVDRDTLVNALLFHFDGSLSGINGTLRPGIVHRLDKDTSGLILVAKNNLAHESLAKQIQEKTCMRIYQCLVQGKVKIPGANLEINKSIGRDPKQRNRMAVITDGKTKARSALTIVKLIEHIRFKENDYSFLECELKTGRTHQIRVHLKHMRHPVLGDLTYGAKKANHIKIERPLLHAKKISFNHPRDNKKMFFEVDLANDFQKVLSILRSS
jgi:23S rRNA pseudouridine1911/1915/1917 synthase